MAEIAVLTVADPADLWSDLGFVVDGADAWVSGICHRLNSPGKGVTGWQLRDGDGIHELPASDGDPPAIQATPNHPNGVVALDHVVVTTPDLDRTIAALESGGVRLRRTRDTGTAEQPTKQAFFRMGETIVEVVGPGSGASPGPARFFGLAFTVADLDATARFLGDRLRPAKDAVQTGRRIATLDRAAGSTIPLAFMSPDG